MSERAPEYKAYVDWYGHGGLVSGLTNWYYFTGDNDLELELTDEQWLRGGESIKVSNANFNNPVRRLFNLAGGVEMTMKLWLYVPDGSANVNVSIRSEPSEIEDSHSVTARDEWVEIEFVVTTTDADTDTYGVYLTQATGSYYIGWFEIRSPLDDISCDVAGTRTVPNITYGRDKARDLEGIRPGEVGLEVLNYDNKYTPGNPDSPLADAFWQNRQVLLTAEYEDTVYTLFIGYTDDFVVDASKDSQSVVVTCVDLLARLNEVDVSTDLHPSIRTGDAFDEVLREAGVFGIIPDKWASSLSTFRAYNPYRDTGASTLRWWARSGTAIDIMNEIMEAEGPPSLYTIGISGQIIFRDRLHRQRLTYPVVPTVTITDCAEPGTLKMTDQSHIDYGWREVINKVSASYDFRTIAGSYSEVWRRPGDVTWGGENETGGNRQVFSGVVDDGFYDAQNPIRGNLQMIENPGPDRANVQSGILPEDYTYIEVRGAAQVINNLTSRSGTKVSITVQDNTTGIGSTTTVRDMTLHAKAVETESQSIESTDSASISVHHQVREETFNFGPVVAPDAQAVADLIVRKRAFRRPTATVVIKNLSPEYTTELLSLDLSTPVTLRSESHFINDVFTIESIDISAGELGEDHEVTLSLEQQYAVEAGTELRFDTEGQGFGDGTWGSSAILTPDTAFILGESVLNGTDMLTY